MTQRHKIQLFEEKKVRTVWNDELQEWFFSVTDVVEVLTDSVDVKQYIKKMRKRDPELDARWGTICTPTRMQATDGKYYNTQAATMEKYHFSSWSSHTVRTFFSSNNCI